MKNNFIFRKEWRDATFWLSDSMRLQFYEAVIEYGFSGKVPELSPLLMRAFNIAKEDIDKEQAEEKDDESEKEPADDEDVPDAGDKPKNKPKTVAIPPGNIAKKENIKKREQDFYETLVPFFDDYGKEMVEAFFRYWSEPNKSLTRMRFELEKTWDVKRRLRTWSDNQCKYNRNGATIQFGTTAEQRAADTANLITEYLLDESD